MERCLPPEEPTAQTGALLTTLLIDAATGILRVIRAVTLSPSFTATLHAAIGAQAAVPWNGTRYDAMRAAVYARCPTSAAMVAETLVRTRGGD